MTRKEIVRSVKKHVVEAATRKSELTRARREYVYSTRAAAREFPSGYDPHRDACIKAWDSDRVVAKSNAREALLAYAFVRGRSYRSQEPKTHEWNPPYSRGIMLTLEAAGVSVGEMAIVDWVCGGDAYSHPEPEALLAAA